VRDRLGGAEPRDRACHGKDLEDPRHAQGRHPHRRPHGRQAVQERHIRQLAPLDRPRADRILHAGARRAGREARHGGRRLRRSQAEGEGRSLCGRQPPHRDPAGDPLVRRPGARAGRLAAAILLAAPLVAGANAAEKFDLQPYQMVRSLELVQDRIAAGDEAAFPMQRKLLEMTDANLLAAPAGAFEDRRNFDALLVYAISGGNPSTIETVVSRLDLKPPLAALGAGVLGYVRGRPAEAEKALHDIDPLTQPIELGAYLALIKGSV